MGKVKHDQSKVKYWKDWISGKLAECSNTEEKQAYETYCRNECEKWPEDVNYHEAVKVMFG